MKSKQAFTLIELLVVVLIIGILAAVALPQYQKAVAKSRATQLISASKQIKDAQQAYHLANNTYATDFDELGLEIGTISYNKSRATFQFGYCSIVENSDRVSCFLSTPHIVFQRFYATEQISCCAYPGDNFKGDEICQSLSNKKSWGNGCSEGTPCHCYYY